MSDKPNNKRNRGKKVPEKEFFSRAASVDAFNTADVLPNPDPIWKQVNATWQNYQDVLWDPHLTAVISSRKSVTLSKEWLIERGKSPARVHKFVEEALKMLDVHRATSEILDARLFGMQPMEPVWGKPRNFEGENKIFPIEFIGRPPYWFQYDKENKLRFRSRENIWPGEEIPPFKLIIPRNNPKYDNPYGEALLSKVYWAVNFKKGSQKFWVEFTEKYGQPFMLGKTQREGGTKEFDAFFELLKKMGRGSVAAVPKNSEIEIVNTNPKSNADVFKELCNFLNAEISKAIIGQTLTTEAGDKGSRSLGQVHDNVRHDLAESDEILCQECFNQLIRWTVDLNFGENVEAPTFNYVHEEDIRKDLAERDTLLKAMGVKFTAEYYQGNYNLGENDFELTEPVEEEETPEFQEFKSKFQDQAAVDAFTDSLTDKDLQKQAKFVQPIIKMIQKAGSFGEANEKLLDLFAKIRPEALEKDLGRAMFVTQTLGKTEDAE